MSIERNKSEKKTFTVRLFDEENEALNRIKEKYGFSKSDVIATLIKKYAKEEYGSF